MDAGATSRSETSTHGAGDAARVAVCAAEDTVRVRIASSLELGGYELPLVCERTEELIEESRLAEPSLVVLGEAFEPFTTPGDVQAVRAALPETPLVLVASRFGGAACRRLVPGEVEGLVPEGQIEQGLLATIDAVLARQLCVPASMRAALAQPVFTHREKQVLELLLAGLTNGEIAARMFLSESTVKSHLASSFRKLGVSSRAEAARSMLARDSSLELRALPTTGH